MKLNNPKKNKKVLFIFLIALIFILCIFLYSNFIDYISIIEKKKIYANIIVGDSYGLDVNGSALMFGMIPSGKGSVSRDIFLTNSYKGDVKVKIYVEGNIKEFLQISDNDFILKKDEIKKVNFIVSAPAGTEHGVYNGYVFVLIKNPIVK